MPVGKKIQFNNNIRDFNWFEVRYDRDGIDIDNDWYDHDDIFYPEPGREYIMSPEGRPVRTDEKNRDGDDDQNSPTSYKERAMKIQREHEERINREQREAEQQLEEQRKRSEQQLENVRKEEERKMEEARQKFEEEKRKNQEELENARKALEKKSAGSQGAAGNKTAATSKNASPAANSLSETSDPLSVFSRFI